MLSLTAVIAIAVGCSVLLIVSATVGIVVWWRLRQDRLSLAMAQARLAATVPVQGFNSILADPARKDAAAQPYGQLPYSLPREWAPLASTETFQLSMSHVKRKREKNRSLRRSISRSLSKRLSLSKGSHQMSVALSPLPTDEATKKTSSTNNDLPDAKEKEPTSTVEGFSELPTEITPRNTPEKDREDATPQSELVSNRSACTAWPFIASNPTFTVLTDQQDRPGQRLSRVRTGSIIAQSAGAAPEMPMPPPPPAAYPRGLYQMPPDDSLMRLSSLSLETANSSILDEGLRASMSVDGELYSPSLPPCPTFTPFSPCDIVRGGSVARDCASQRRSQSQRLSSSTARLTVASSDSYKLDLGGCSPRRSLSCLTMRESPQPSPERTGQLPRRSETVLSPSGSRRPASCAPFSSRLSTSSAQTQSQQRYSMYEVKDDRLRTMQSPSRSPVLKDSASTARAIPLQSAMRSAHGPRKGHRRQNSVRISAYPPITFGGPAFSPMLEEPEEGSELESGFGGHAPSNQQQQQQQIWGAAHVSPNPRRHSRHCSTGFIPERRRSSSSILNLNPGIYGCSPGTMNSSRGVVTRSNTSRKRSHSRMGSGSADDDVFVCRASPSPSPLSPSPSKHSLSRTPSPEKPAPEPEQSSGYLPRSDAVKFATGSPQRYALRSSRGVVPVRQTQTVRNSVPATTTTVTTTTITTGSEDSTTPKRALTTVQSPSKDVRKSITLLRRMNSEAWDEDSRAYRRMGGGGGGGGGGSPSTSTSPSPIPLSRSRSSRSNRSSLAGLSNASSVTIWEDACEDEAEAEAASASTTPSLPPQQHQRQPSSSRRKRFSIMERIDSEGNDEDDNNSSNNNSSSNTNDKNKSSNPTTPHNTKPKGLGLAGTGTGDGPPSTAPTPAGSLYDRDGFLKE